MSDRRVVKLVKPQKRPDMAEVIQLALEVVQKWSNGFGIAEDLNLAESELSDCEVNFKSIERSEAKDDSVNVFMNDGTSYQISIKRTDNNFR